MFYKRLCLFLMFLFCTQFAQGQLSNFTLSATKIDETCTANGSLSFSVSNTTPGSVILYSIYLLPNVTTPYSVQSSTTISGLTSGTYRIVATQSIGNQSGSQQQDITIADFVHHLSYQINATREICGNDGVITVNVTTGNPVNYEIFSGPMTRPLQSSNVFTGLTHGVYQIRVFDNCNEGVVQTFTLLKADTNLNIDLFTPYLASCTTVNVGFNFESVLDAPLGVVKFPIEVTTTLLPPSGPSITFNQTINSGAVFVQSVPFYTNQPYNYSMVITDGCGTIYNVSGVINNLSIAATYTLLPQDCTHKQVTFFNVSALTLVAAPASFGGTVPLNLTPTIVSNSTHLGDLTAGTYIFNAIDVCGNPQVFTIEVVIVEVATPFTLVYNVNCTNGNLLIYEISQLIMTSAPSSYTVPLPHDYTSLINSAYYAAFVQLPVGTYVFDVLDRCGSPHVLTVTIAPTSQSPEVSVLEGCENGFGSLQIIGELVSISLTSAPTAYGGTVPSNLTANVTTGDTLTLDMLPPGNYVFHSTNSCTIPYTTNVTILGYQESTSAVVIPNCGSFNINLNHTSNNNDLAKFWLQKYNPLTTTWGHPLTNVAYADNTVPNSLNSFELNNNAINYNLAYSGHFRILKVFNTYSSGTSSDINCFKVIDEFDFSDAPRIIDVYSISCGSTFEVVVNAEGNSALTYRITTKNGLPFLIENGSSSVFSDLAPAIYNFQVEDECHNSVNSQFEVLNPNPLVITATPIFCNGQSASLTAPNFPFLTYQWWKDNNTTVILSTANSLNFTSFNSAANNGTYHVMITYTGNPNSCLNQTLNYTINVNNPVPHAGSDNAVSYCGRQGTIDLSGLLIGNFDAAGEWTELTSSNMLLNNLWNSATVLYGTYQFKYRVTGPCNTSDEALINITIKEIPEIPVASVDPILCEGQNLNLFATNVANATYHWTGPNGFTSTVQNPILNSVSANDNGIYTVYTSQNGCQSGNSNVIVTVSPLPAFILNQNCIDRQYQVWVTKLNDTSYDETLSTFSWVGPNNFTSNQPTITITGGQIGFYSLTITNENGCDATNGIDVVRTTCFIPNVITPNNDGSNETFDLAGFGVTKLEIYNRWGRKVYEKNDYLDEWHGQNMNGGLLPDSTYFYIVRLGSEETKTGWIFLSRG